MTSMAAVGDVLAGKYRVDQILGIGGMGMVVAATHLELDQRVALKFMLPAALASDQAMDRFLREAKSAVRLRSEHICRVLDVGKLDNGAPYIVMEFMEGHDFAQLIKQRGVLPLADAVDHVMQAIEGLAEAHANGIVHRDLKPGNLFVCADNDGSLLVKVLDFGISKSSLGAGGMATRTGDIMGSPAYMAPEQMMSSKNVDGRADLWALGVILYQAVTGILPFEAETLPALCMSVMNSEPVSPACMNATLPPAFAAVVMRCLAKKPTERYADVGELATALAPFGGDDAVSSARRAGKVLRRATTSSPAVLPAVSSAASSFGVAPTLMTSSDPQPTAPVATGPVTGRAPYGGRATPGRISTLQASAAELAVAAGPKKKSRLGLFGAAGALAVAGIVGIALAAGGGAGGAPAPGPVVPVAATPVAPPPVTPPPAVPPPLAVTPPPVTPPIEVAKPADPPAPLSGRPRPGHVVTAPAHKIQPPQAPVTSPVPHVTETVKATEPVKPPSKPAEPKPAEPKPAEPKPIEPKPAEPKPAEDKWMHMQHDKGTH